MKAIEINKRTLKEKGKQVRAKGFVPGIIFGKSLENNIPIKVENSTLLRLLNSTSDGSIIKLKMDDSSNICVVKKVDKDAVSGKIIHIEFQQITEKEVIKLKLSVNLKGHENLALKRLVVENCLNEIELQGEVEKIPEYIELYVGDKDYNDKIFVKDIPLPEGVKFITDPETLLAIVN